MGAIHRVRRALRRYNVLELCALVAYNIYHRARALVPSSVRSRFSEPDFDSLYGTDSGGFMPLEAYDLEIEQLDGAVPFETITARRFHKIMRSLGTPVEDKVFIDFGSGKGRQILLASLYPFKKVVGVEFEPSLHAIAQRNIQIFRDQKQKCLDILAVCEDATDFEIPEQPLVCFFYNPFDDKHLKIVMRNIEDSLVRLERDVHVIYQNPVHRDLFDDSPNWEAVLTSVFSGYVIYRNRR